MALTTLSNLINPEVLADMVDVKLHDLIRFAPLAEVDNTLVGNPGDTLTLPSYSYIGDAEVLAEGSTLTPVSLTTASVSVTVAKIAKGVELTDEAVLSGYGDPMGQATMQIATAIANKVDNQMLSALAGISGTMVYTTSTSTTAIEPADISDALELFGEDIDVGEKVVVVSPKLYNKIRKTTAWLPASEISAERIIAGAVGEIYGCQIIVSNKLKDADHDYDEEAYIVKPGALRLIMKRDTLIETDRDILKFSTVITGSKHEVCYLYDGSKAIRIKKHA